MALRYGNMYVCTYIEKKNSLGLIGVHTSTWHKKDVQIRGHNIEKLKNNVQNSRTCHLHMTIMPCSSK